MTIIVPLPTKVSSRARKNDERDAIEIFIPDDLLSPTIFP